MSLLHASGQHLTQSAPRFSRTNVRASDAGLVARLARQIGQGLRHWGYGSRFYEWRLGGKLPLQLLAVVDAADSSVSDAIRSEKRSRGQVLMDGQFGAAPHQISFGDDFWDELPVHHPSFTAAHNFSWIADIASASTGDGSKKLVQRQVTLWCARYTRFDQAVWAPAILSRRLINWLIAAPIVMGSTDAIYRSHVLLALSKQLRHLCRTARDADGADRITSGCALMLGGLLLPHGDTWLKFGTSFLGQTTHELIRADGSPYDRNARSLGQMLADMALVASACRARDHLFPAFLQAAFDRAGPWVRMLMLPDGRASGLFGLSPDDIQPIADILSGADAHGQAPFSAPHSGIQRLSAGAASLLVDAGPPPAVACSHNAPASTAAMEFCDGRDRIFVAMGRADMPPLADLVRTTAAHSVAVLDNRNSNSIGPDGLLGDGITHVTVDRQHLNRLHSEQLTIGHDGYVSRLGQYVERRLRLAEDGLSLEGRERATVQKRSTWQFWHRAKAHSAKAEMHLRFHLHPDISCQVQADHMLLCTASGKAWRFTADQPILLEDSLWMADAHTAQPSRQLVVSAPLADRTDINWQLTRLS